MEEKRHSSRRHKQLPELPNHILIDILARLPTKSILACRCVCKTFLNSTKNNPEFANLHFSKSQPELLVQFCDEYDASDTVYLVDFESDATQGFSVPVRIRSIFNFPEHHSSSDGFVIGKSCRGLICLGLDEICCSSTLAVMNPLTCEYVMLPKPDESGGEKKSMQSFVFGYSPSSNEFKVLCFFICSIRERESTLNSVVMETAYARYQVEINVVGTDSWRCVSDVSYSHHDISYPCFLHKAIHWICYDMKVSDFVVYFDFETEQFGEIPSPAVLGISSSKRLNLTLGVLGDNLFLCDVHRSRGQFQIWVMKEYGVRESWDIQFTINIGGLGVRLKGQYLPVKCLKNGEIILISDDNVLLCCDPLRKTVRLLKHYPVTMPSRFIIHTPSFVSIKETLNLFGRDVNVLNINPRIVGSWSTNLCLAEYYWSSPNEKRRVTRNFLNSRDAAFC